tara:strand:+ start:257 stop:1057 length:801 start_codon:yes stop_codon:yes gene_type:complete
LQFNLKVLEGSNIDTQKLFAFLKNNYNQGAPVEVSYSKAYLDWFFLNNGILGVFESGNEWVAIFCLGRFTMRYNNYQGEVFNSGPLCVHKKYLFKNLAQDIVCQTNAQIKLKYNLPILGAGVTGVRKKTMFKGFGMFLSSKIRKPDRLCFSSNNFYLCDKSLFLKKFKHKEGILSYYEQDVANKGKVEKWLVICSYFTVGCWKTLIYNFYLSYGEKYNNILIFENLERKEKDLKEIGFEKMTSYNLYIDSPANLPEYFLYYNLFTY